MVNSRKKKCPECSEKLKNQGIRTRQIHTGTTGIITILRYYYTCQNKKCNYSCCPLDNILDISPNLASEKDES
jgi:hypothetical protein